MTPLARSLRACLERDPADLARVALVLARVECPALDPDPPLLELERLGASARQLVLASGPSSTVKARVAAVNHLLYEVEGFRGNAGHYDDVRNSLLHCVLARRLGIPISLAVVYITVARSAGLEVLGVPFPGHFLLRVPADAGDDSPGATIIDPFNGGRTLDEPALQGLLARYAGDIPLSAGLLRPCGTREIVVRMLHNMKRLYVQVRSFPHAWTVADLLVDLGHGVDEVRDRGLLAGQIGRFTDALQDLEDYGRATTMTGDGDERAHLLEQLALLRRRVAALN